jgi:hypothetical protein
MAKTLTVTREQYRKLPRHVIHKAERIVTPDGEVLKDKHGPVAGGRA